jgi:NAD(P)-dependent dehydrogenase (short-subunit alcohol dehydrogenase family)
MEGIAGRVAIVTGAGRGIGREHALLLASLGASVVVNDVHADVAREVVAEIERVGGQAVPNDDDVASFDGAARLVASAVDAFGDLHVVVNNAAISRDLPLLELSEADFDAVLAVNLKGTFNVTRHAGEHWRRATEAGRLAPRAIVNTSSGAGLHGTAAGAAYASSKAGVAAMTVVAAGDLAPFGVTVNAIAPIARTRMTMSAPGVAELMAAEAFDPANISPLVAVLAAEGCPFTGQVFSVCGPTVGLYGGWSIAEEVRADGRWTAESLRAAMGALPTTVPVRDQGVVLMDLAGLT